MRIYLTGADGMLGTALIAALAADECTAHWPVHGVSIMDFDIADADSVRRSTDDFAPDVVIHTAAHTIVDACEADPKLALRVNIEGTRNIVRACLQHEAKLVYISSDYVFDGSMPPIGGYREVDMPNPLSVYGLTKLAGERIVAILPDHLTVRTSWLFGGQDERTDNVLALVLRAFRGERSGLIHDQFSCPTYTDDVARAIVHLLTRPGPLPPTVHVVNSGTASWHQVGEVVVDALRTLVPDGTALLPPKAITMAGCGFLGGRPKNSSLNTELLAGLGFVLPHWADAVRAFCAKLVRTDPSPASVPPRNRRPERMRR